MTMGRWMLSQSSALLSAMIALSGLLPIKAVASEETAAIAHFVGFGQRNKKSFMRALRSKGPALEIYDALEKRVDEKAIESEAANVLDRKMLKKDRVTWRAYLASAASVPAGEVFQKYESTAELDAHLDLIVEPLRTQTKEFINSDAFIRVVQILSKMSDSYFDKVTCEVLREQKATAALKSLGCRLP